MIKKLLTSAVLLTSLVSPQIAEAATRYGAFRVGSLRVNSATVRHVNNGRTQLKVNMTMPTCTSRYYLEGTVYGHYTSKNGGYFKNKVLARVNSKIRNVEGTTLNGYASTKHRLNTSGKIRVSHNLQCKALAPLRSINPVGTGIRGTRTIKKKVENEIRRGGRRIDPTRGLFW